MPTKPISAPQRRATPRDGSRNSSATSRHRVQVRAALSHSALPRGRFSRSPQGFRVASRAQPGRAAAVFETSVSLTARGEHNAIPLSAVAPTNQFAQLWSFAQVFVETGPLNLGLAQELYYGAGRTYLKTLRAARTLPTRVATPAHLGPASNLFAAAAFAKGPSVSFVPVTGTLRPPIVYHPYVSLTTRTVVLDGANNQLLPGDYLLTVEKEHEDDEKPSLYQVSSVSVDKASNTTTIRWQEKSGATYQQDAKDPVALYALRVRASPFASGAPNWYTLSPTLTAQSSPPVKGTTVAPPYVNWDGPGNASLIPADQVIALDGIYDEARATPDKPSWFALVSAKRVNPLTYEVHGFIGARPGRSHGLRPQCAGHTTRAASEQDRTRW